MPKLLKSIHSYPRCGPKSEMLKLEKNRISIIHKRIRNKPNRYKPINFLKKPINFLKKPIDFLKKKRIIPRNRLEVLDSIGFFVGYFGTYYYLLTYLPIK